MPNLRDDLKRIMEAKKAGQPIPKAEKPKLGPGLVEPATKAEVPPAKQKTEKTILGTQPSVPAPTPVPIPTIPMDVPKPSSDLPKTQETDLTKMEREAAVKEGAVADALANQVVTLMDSAGKQNDRAETAPEEAPQSAMVAAEKKAGSSLRFTTKDFQLADEADAPSEPAPSPQSRIPTEEAVVPRVPASSIPSFLSTPIPSFGSLELESEPGQEEAEETPAQEPARTRTVSDTLAFAEKGDSGRIGSRYKLAFERMAGPDRCEFTLIGREVRALELVKGEEQTLSVRTSNGEISVTLKFLGANEYGKKEVEYQVEGDIASVSDVLEKSRKVGEFARDQLYSLIPDAGEISLSATGIVLGVLMLTTPVAEHLLGRLQAPYAILTMVVAGGLAIWSGVERYFERKY